jgi:predicted CopG family antitoxin
MAKLKERKLYLKGIQKFSLGGLTNIPQSPFTKSGLTQSGIAALDLLKNPKTYGKAALTMSGLRNPYTAVPALAYLGYQAIPESVKERARLEGQVEGLPEIYDEGALPRYPKSLNELRREVALNKSVVPVANQKTNEQSRMDDRETGAEVIEKGGSKIQPNINDLPPNINEQAQMAVTKQKEAIKKAENSFLSLEGKALKTGKMGILGDALEQARAVMGEQGYDKSGRLLLLQLASNLLSGQTMQPGITGFLDVLGQAGQKVIPMAIALERERQKDEIDLAKILLTAESKGTKISPPSIKLRYKLSDGTISDPLPASTTDRGTYIVYDQLPDGKVVNYEVSPGQVVGQADIKDSPTNKSKILNEYKAVKAGDLYTSTFLRVATQNPDLIGVEGGLEKITLKFFELFSIATGSKSYKDTILKLVDRERNNFEAFQMYGEVEDGVEKKLNGVFSKIENLASDLEGSSEKIQAQSLLETLSLLSTYALAQILKDKDRLAIRDIEKAEESVGNVISYIPFVNKNPLEILTSYKITNQKFKNRIKNLRGQWKDIYYYNPLELDAIDNIYATEMKDPNQENINNFIGNFNQQNDKDAEMFNQLFNKNNLKGIIGKQQ